MLVENDPEFQKTCAETICNIFVIHILIKKSNTLVKDCTWVKCMIF